MNGPRVLLVDDDEDMLRLLSIRISAAGYDVVTATDGSQALALARAQRPDVVVTDLKMPGMDGMNLLDALQRELPALPVVIVTAHGTIPDAVAATRKGAFGFITKPVDKADLLSQLERATAGWSGHQAAVDTAMITRNATMQELMDKAARAARAAIAVLLTGESGTGKELMARFIHESSGRPGDFVAVNCGAIPGSLLESELFGHQKGAFTGADSAREGLVQAADHGTLFLDEIGDMPLGLQAKVLRVLQERTVRPVGAESERQVDLLVVSATHRDIESMVERGEFREDLYYRLNVVPLSLPPLRERPEDIPLLAGHFLAQSATGERKVFSPEAMEVLVGQKWRGNVRQLHNVVQRIVAMASSPVISAAQVREALGEPASRVPSFQEAREEFTRQYLVQLMKLTQGNVSRAARLAERNRTDFHKLLKKHGIDSARFKE